LNVKYLDLLAQFYRNILLFTVSILHEHFNIKPAPFHEEIYHILQEKHKFTCIVAPRGHSKSTTITLGYVIHQILFKRANFIIILSDTYTQAKYFLDAIKKEFETNDLLKWLFGEMQGSVWGESEIETTNGVRIIARGAEQKIRGIKWKQFRPDLIIVDDLENEELTANKERRIKLEQWFWGSVVPALGKDGRLVVIGTILHYDSLLNKLQKSELFKTLFYRAVENNTALWQDRYSLEDLNEIKENYKAQGLLNLYYCEYQNEPLSDENAIFKKSWFKYFKDEPESPLIKSLSKFITVDPAISQKETADYTVIMVTGIDALNQIYVLDYIHERLNPSQTIEGIFTLAKKWEVKAIGIEGVAYQRSLQWFFEEEMKRRNEYYLVEELKADVDKERRIKGLQPRYAIGSVYHRTNMTSLEEELLLFPKAANDDLADALAYVPQIAFPGKSLETVPQPENERVQAHRLHVEGDSEWASY
jgi:predicted phage terminase large subunit-like protein